MAAVSIDEGHYSKFVAHVTLGDDSTGYFVQPTVILTKDAKSVTMVEEIFGPVLTVSAF